MRIAHDRHEAWHRGVSFGLRLASGTLAVGALLWLDLDRPVADVLARWQARSAYLVLRVFDTEALLSGVLLSVPHGTLQVTKECTGFTLIALLTVAMVAYPARWRHRLAGILAALPLVFGLDVARVVSLALALRHGPAVFDLLHGIVWEGAFILVTLAYWLLWTRGAGS